MTDFIKHVFGDHPASYWAASLLFVLLGQLVWKFISYKKKKSVSRFSFTYWIRDNYRDAGLALFLSFILIRFGDALVVRVIDLIPLGISDVEDVFFHYIVIGFFFQYLLGLLRNVIPALKTSLDDKPGKN